MLEIGEKAPDFALRDADGNLVRLGDFRGRKVVLYFYPKDDTPGCTREACDFRDAREKFDQTGAAIVGISPDDVDSHHRFRAKFGLSFLLLADPEKEAIQAYGVWKEKSRDGRTYMGVERSTFLIDEQGVLRQALRQVQVEGHVAQVLAGLAG